MSDAKEGQNIDIGIRTLYSIQYDKTIFTLPVVSSCRKLISTLTELQKFQLKRKKDAVI
jgi:hypothetical protein